MSSFPCLVRFVSGSGQVRYRLVDRYLEFVAGRCRPDMLRAVAFDLKAFFTVTGKDPVEVAAADAFECLAYQRGDRMVVRLADRESGLSARTIARRLSSVSGLYAYLVARGDTPVQVNPVPRGLLTRRQGGSRRSRTAPLVRVPRTLPRILPSAEADRLVGALRTHRDRAMVLAMLLARTGMRAGELAGLEADAVVQMGAGHWLRIPLGKLRNDRYVPLHPELTDLLAAWTAANLEHIRHCKRLVADHRGPLDRYVIGRVVARVARAAGVPGVHPHRLRHTPATHLEVSRIASDASFGRSREHALPAAQRAGLGRWRRAGAFGGGCDLGCQQLVASDARVCRLIRLQRVAS